MKTEDTIDPKKFQEIIDFANEELEKRSNDGSSKDNAATHIAEKMKEILSK